MAFERKDLQGAAFKNDKKIEDWHADFRGDILVEGTDYYLDITKKEPANGGATFLRVTLKPKNATAKAAVEKVVTQEASPFDDDDFGL